jgi:hypothetical protein
VKKKNGETWYQSHLVDQELHQLLEKVDADLAQEACQKGCLHCQGKLHRADYDRKPRGGPHFELEERQRLLAVLQFLGPITTPTARKEQAI